MSKELQALETLNDRHGLESKEYSIVLNGLKALEIIKEKDVWLYHLKQCNSLEEYNEAFIDDLHITQEEYDLLKEVLL